MRVQPMLLAVASLAFSVSAVEILDERAKYGKLVGELNSTKPGDVEGDVYVADEHTIIISNFTLKQGINDAHFCVSQNKSDKNSAIPLSNISAGLQLHELHIKTGVSTVYSVSICNNESKIYGQVEIAKGFSIPAPRNVGKFSRLNHGLKSGNITILDAKTFNIPDLHYDGKAPTAFFWVGNGSVLHKDGIKVANEKGSYNPIPNAYTGQNITIRLPENVTVYDIQWLGMYCVKFDQNFGFVSIPKGLNVPAYLGKHDIPNQDVVAPSSSHKSESSGASSQFALLCNVIVAIVLARI